MMHIKDISLLIEKDGWKKVPVHGKKLNKMIIANHKIIKIFRGHVPNHSVQNVFLNIAIARVVHALHVHNS